MVFISFCIDGIGSFGRVAGGSRRSTASVCDGRNEGRFGGIGIGWMIG